MSEKSLIESASNVEIVSKADLRDSANQTNNRIDSVDTHLAAVVEKIGVLIEAQIRSEERDGRNTETLIRLEKNQIEQGKRQGKYESNNDVRVTDLEKQVMLLEIEDKMEEKIKSKAQARKDKITSGIITGLSIVAILAIFQAIAPYLGKQQVKEKTEARIQVEGK